MLRRLRFMLAILACALSAAHAQLPEQDDDQIIVVPAFGFDAIMPAERWGPIRFTITSPQRHLVGILSLTYPQDGSQSFVAGMPVTLTAGTPSPVDFFVCLPRSVDRITLSMRDDRNRAVFSRTFNVDGSGRALAATSPAFTPPSLVDERITILSLGNRDLLDAGDRWSRSLFIQSTWDGGGRVDKTLAFEQQYRVSTLMPENAFAAWTAYDGLAALVADASTLGRLPERARREILHWLQGGGTLLLRVDDNSDSWRRWLPASSHWDLLTLDDLRPVDTPGTLSMLVPPHAKLAGYESDSALETSTSISARAVRLTARGERLGFERLWVLDDQRALAARGPVGFGTLVVLGFDPAHLPALRSGSGAAAGWAATLEAAITHDQQSSGDVWSYAYSSGASGRNAQAISSLVDSAVVGAGVPGGLLVLVVLLLVAMAVAIGPFDALVLRRCGLRHWSWLTASGWITLCSGFMLIFPALQRSDTSVLSRITITDALLDEHAAAVVSWKTGLNVAYAGENGLIGPVDERPGAWWRGVSPLRTWYYSASTQTLSPLRAVQQPLPGPEGARVSCLPRLPSQRVWTVRATLDQSADLPPIVARLERSGSNYTVHLGEADLRITSLRVIVGDRAMEARDAQPGQLVGLTPFQLIDRSDDGTVDPHDSYLLSDEAQSNVMDPMLVDLPGPDQRTRAMWQMVDAGHYALLVISYETDQPDLRLVGAGRTRCRGAVRLVVPIAEPPQEPSP